jgi:hypothetical protein
MNYIVDSSIEVFRHFKNEFSKRPISGFDFDVQNNCVQKFDYLIIWLCFIEGRIESLDIAFVEQVIVKLEKYILCSNKTFRSANGDERDLNFEQLCAQLLEIEYFVEVSLLTYYRKQVLENYRCWGVSQIYKHSEN